MSVIGAGPVALVGSQRGEQPIQHGLLAAADEPPEHHQLLGNVAGSAQRTIGPKGIHASPGTATLVETSRPGSPSVWPTARAVVMLGDEPSDTAGIALDAVSAVECGHGCGVGRRARRFTAGEPDA